MRNEMEGWIEAAGRTIPVIGRGEVMEAVIKEER